VLPFRSLVALAAIAFIGALPSVAHAQLNLMCSAPAAMCRLLAEEFQKETGINTMIVSTGGRAVLAAIAEQKGRPQGDVWLGGSAGGHYRAEKFDLVDTYASPAVKELQPWAQQVAEQSKSQSVGIYARVVGIGYNSTLATQKKLAAPACWKDLAKPGYAGEVRIADPRTSGATYAAITSMAQIFGEEQAFKYLKAMYMAEPAKKGHGRADVSGMVPKGAPTSRGAPPSGNKSITGGSGSKGGRGGKGSASETADSGPVVGSAIAGIGFISDVVAEAEGGAPVKAVAPCEGTVMEVGALSIVKGARNLDNAKKFVDWTLGAKAQVLIVKASRAYPANTTVASSPLAPKWSDIKFIDVEGYSKSAAHKQLIEKWKNEIAGSAP
jgi:iron(III) transport system substrate-binding protein